MKIKINLMFFAVLCSATSIFAQFASISSKSKPFTPSIVLEKNKENKAQRISFGLNYGFHPMSVKAGTVELKYTDESPAPDVIQKKIALTDSKGALVFSGNIEWQSKRNIMYHIQFGGGKNGKSNTRTNFFDFGVGYAFGNERFQFYPMIDFIASNASVNFGVFKNETGYVEINNTEIYAEDITTKLNLSFAGFRPSLGGHFAINRRFGVQASVGYLLANPNGKAKIEFSATNPNQNGDDTSSSVSASELLSESNVNFLVNDKRVTSRPDIFGGKGLTWNVGITFGINRMFDGK